MYRKNTIVEIIIILFILEACTTNKNNKVSLENKQWEPVNKNYMNKKDF